jgi:hypothetical protein
MLLVTGRVDIQHKSIQPATAKMKVTRQSAKLLVQTLQMKAGK